MKGWHLFRHALKMISGNVGAAFRVTGLPYVVMLAITLLLPAIVPAQPTAAGFLVPFAIAMVAYLLAFVWMAVQWHRYVLLGEIQSGIVPHWHGSASRAYLLRSIFLGLLTLVLAAVALFVSHFLVMAMPSAVATLVLNVAAMALVLTVIGRISPVLPAAAVNDRLSIGEAWAATAGGTGAILVSGVLLTLLSFVPAILVALGLGIIAAVSSLAFQWLVTVLGLCLMTTIYGHYVEGRDLLGGRDELT
ncbi:hypothetical protein [Palleronia sp. LCG004]|uniref:hypothetical protein n=1 Tax=Palleronia sp. LCG004 TaxID=3079304 RepID=UPI002942F606|nr:hypothetical protein [Palleronia sp. LCG004]WOI55957.1 hypothetical protein RVY76_13085 [Palleronia sp. LCG004]